MGTDEDSETPVINHLHGQRTACYAKVIMEGRSELRELSIGRNLAIEEDNEVSILAESVARHTRSRGQRQVSRTIERFLNGLDEIENSTGGVFVNAGVRLGEEVVTVFIFGTGGSRFAFQDSWESGTSSRREKNLKKYVCKHCLRVRSNQGKEKGRNVHQQRGLQLADIQYIHRVHFRCLAERNLPDKRIDDKEGSEGQTCSCRHT